MSVFMIIADNEIDQIVETKAAADKERTDLKAMGCSVQIKRFDSWQQADDYEDRRNRWPSSV
jgi:hypothetical protein